MRSSPFHFFGYFVGVGVSGFEELRYYIFIAFIITVLAEFKDGIDVGDLYFEAGDTLNHVGDVATGEIVDEKWVGLGALIFFSEASKYVDSSRIIGKRDFSAYMHGLVIPCGAHFFCVPARAYVAMWAGKENEDFRVLFDRQVMSGFAHNMTVEKELTIALGDKDGNLRGLRFEAIISDEGHERMRYHEGKHFLPVDFCEV